MRYAIIADIHANLAAFSEVLHDIAHRGGVDELWCLGDIVGYGPDPHECIDLLRQYNHVCVAGNHDLASIGKIDASTFNTDAIAACQWTARQLSPEDAKYIRTLPMTASRGDFTLVHGSPRDHVWEYILSTGIAMENLAFFQSPFCLIGHTHVPMFFKCEGDSCAFNQFSPNIGLVLGKNRLIINPGGVGQPRDSDPRASYAIYDSDINLVKLYRVPYDIEATQARMMGAGLPIRLIGRLGHGV